MRTDSSLVIFREMMNSSLLNLLYWLKREANREHDFLCFGHLSSLLPWSGRNKRHKGLLPGSAGLQMPSWLFRRPRRGGVRWGSVPDRRACKIGKISILYPRRESYFLRLILMKRTNVVTKKNKYYAIFCAFDFPKNTSTLPPRLV